MARGRPKDPELQEKTRSALLEAARVLLYQKSYSTISIRELAAEAGTQSGMISYYFGNKKGLISELLKRTAAERKKKLADISTEVMANRDQAFEILVDKIIDLLLGEPWLFRLFHDEVTFNDSEIKPVLLAEFSDLSKSGLVSLFALLQQEGEIRKDINLNYLVASFMSLIAFPIMNQPMLEGSMGIDPNVVESRQWKRHVSELFRRSVT